MDRHLKLTNKGINLIAAALFILMLEHYEDEKIFNIFTFTSPTQHTLEESLGIYTLFIPTTFFSKIRYTKYTTTFFCVVYLNLNSTF